MGPRFIDLHVHTSASDGSDSPAEVVRKAATLGLAALAVTDHDTLAGLAEAGQEAAGQDIELVRGCEISTMSPFGEIHILGLWLSEDNLFPLEELLRRSIDSRQQRNVLIAEKLAELGLPVRYDEVLELAGGDVVGRPHFAEYLLRQGIVSSRAEAFQKYLRDGACAYVPRQLASPEEGVAVLAASGRIVSLAHPCLNAMPRVALEEMIKNLVPLGLNAIEAYHSEHSHKDERFCVEMASRYGLLLTGGSDYHGSSKPGISLGRGKGGLRVTTAVLDRLKEAMRPERAAPAANSQRTD